MQPGRELRSGTVVAGQWRIVRTLGAGGFGITYEATTVGDRRAIALKEFLPFGFGARDERSDTVRPAPGREGDMFNWGRERFMKEASIIARLDHPAIIKVESIVEANGTAYMALAYEDGITLAEWLARLGRPPSQAELDALLDPILDALTQVHSLFLLHRDIAPDNIMLRQDGAPVLIDFGAAKAALAGQSRALARTFAVGKDGYSPPEQYTPQEALQGPWTDIYALAATLFRAVSGSKPPDAAGRMIEDTMVPLADLPGPRLSHYRPEFIRAIDRALSLRRDDRPQSAVEFRRALGLGSGPLASRRTDVRSAGDRTEISRTGADVVSTRPADQATPVDVPRQQGLRSRLPLLAMALLAAIGWGLWAHKQRAPVAEPSSLTSARHALEAEVRQVRERNSALEAELTREREARRQAEDQLRSAGARHAQDLRDVEQRLRRELQPPRASSIAPPAAVASPPASSPAACDQIGRVADCNARPNCQWAVLRNACVPFPAGSTLPPGPAATPAARRACREFSQVSACNAVPECQWRILQNACVDFP